VKRIIVKPGEEVRLLAGHPWVFDNEVARVLGPTGPAELEAGELVEVESSRKTYIGRAFANPHSKIVARIYSPSKDGVDKGFFKHRIREARERREGPYALDRESARIVFAEADFLPGLIVDRFVGWPLATVLGSPGGEAAVAKVGGFDETAARCGPPQSWLSVQLLSFGMDARRQEVLEALQETLGVPAGIVERDEAPVRELEGLPLRSGVVAGSYPEEGILIYENGLPFAVDLLGGQKTGHFLDQRDMRRRAAAYAPGKRVLDLFCHTGGFAVHAARAGAAETTAVDSSAPALAQAARNAALNGVADRLSVVQADVFELLRAYEREKRRFDLIVLDPPAFAKNRSALEAATRGYKEINLRALGLLERGGVLVTCSCSHAMDEGRFKDMVAAAATDAGRRLHLLDFRYQAADHPVLVGYDESLYLKCGFYRVAR